MADPIRTDAGANFALHAEALARRAERNAAEHVRAARAPAPPPPKANPPPPPAPPPRHEAPPAPRRTPEETVGRNLDLIA